MRRILPLAAITALAFSTFAAPALADHHTASSAATHSAKNIVETAVATPALSTLVAALRAADLVGTLASPGPFTVFAPTNAAFAKLPAGTVETLVKPENKGTLTTVLTYHVIAGRFTSGNVIAAIRKGKGKAVLTTVQGHPLTATMHGRKLILTDAKGGRSVVTTANLMQSNGVVHVIDTVLMP